MNRSPLASLWLVLPALTALAQAPRPARPPAPPCGQPPVEGCRERREQIELRAKECVLRLERVAVGSYDDSAGEVLLLQQLEAAFETPDGGVGRVETLARDKHVEGASESFELWQTPAGVLLHTSHSVYPAGADYELGPMDTAQALEWVAVAPPCRLARAAVTGAYVDQATGERLALSAPTLPHDGARDELLRVVYSSPRRPAPFTLELRSFDPAQRTAVVAFRDKSAYRVQLEPGALLVTPVAGGKTQRFVRKE